MHYYQLGLRMIQLFMVIMIVSHNFMANLAILGIIPIPYDTYKTGLYNNKSMSIKVTLMSGMQWASWL